MRNEREIESKGAKARSSSCKIQYGMLKWHRPSEPYNTTKPLSEQINLYMVKHFLWKYPYRKYPYFTLHFLFLQHSRRSTQVKTTRAFLAVIKIREEKCYRHVNLTRNG